MLSKGQRLTNSSVVVAFEWGGSAAVAEPQDIEIYAPRPAAQAHPAPAAPPPPPPTPAEPGPDVQARVAALEREAFTTGYAQGERAGMEAGTKRADAMLRRLSETLQELEELRRSMIRQTEQQVVQLALAIAKRILRHEVVADQDLLCAMARVALDRLGDSAPATIRLHPDDHANVVARHGGQWGGTHVTLKSDSSVSRGGCLVESPFGFIDASVEAQFRVLEDALVTEHAGDARAGDNRGR
jgi:flagellar assembly protein FliH